LIPLKENKMRINGRKAGTKGAIAAMLLVGMALCANLAIGQPPAQSSNDQQVPKRDRYLLLDARVIERVEHAKLTVGAVRKDEHNPLFKEDKPWEPYISNLYGYVIYDEQDRLYKCWYNGFIESKMETETPREKRAWVTWSESPRAAGVCYAVSKDGVHWEKPELGIIDFQGSKKNNIVLRADHGFGMMKDPHETDPQKRYKAILPRPSRKGHSSVWFSPDGLHWGEERRIAPIDDGDTYNCVFWDPTLSKYVLFTRHWGGAKTSGRYGRRLGYRQVSRSESPDFVNWTPAEVVFKAPNPEQQQIHDMIVFRHAGVYVGLVGLWDMVADREHVELAWSPDSITWKWIEPGKALIPNSRHIGDYDWGCIFAIPPIFKKDEILLYYGSNDNRFFGWRDTFLSLAHLRPDGFAGYEDFPGGTDITAAITTTPVVAVTDSLCLSADVALSGYVKVVLIDEDNRKLAESELIPKSVTDASVQWKDGFSLADRVGKKIQLRFELRDAKLYSFSFDD